ncbi:MAG TPA: hypothetical protein VK638_46300, partial [Edaphobacter sp.]|nr:hypothetical protein [Edaphobacter sp.]
DSQASALIEMAPERGHFLAPHIFNCRRTNFGKPPAGGTVGAYTLLIPRTPTDELVRALKPLRYLSRFAGGRERPHYGHWPGRSPACPASTFFSPTRATKVPAGQLP